MVGRQRAGEFATCQNSHSVKPEKPDFTPPSSPVYVLGRHLMKHMILQHKTVSQYSYRSRFPEVRSAKFYGRREELLTILSRGKVDPEPHGLYHLVPHPVCCSSPAITTSLPPRNHHHMGLPSMYGSTRCKPCLNNLVYHRVGYRTGLRNRRADII